MKQKLESWLPPFVRIPLLLALVINFLTYYGTKLVTTNAKHYDLTIGLDKAIPFVPFFISFYVLAYAQWVFSYIYHSKQSKTACNTIVSANIITKIIASLFFLFLPTETVLPEIAGNSFWEQLTQFIYNADTPRTLFPSLHCIESWLCFRSSFYVKNASKWYIFAQLAFSIMVFASTVFVKQHFIVDVFAGILAAEIGLTIAKKKNFGTLFEKLQNKMKSS